MPTPAIPRKPLDHPPLPRRLLSVAAACGVLMLSACGEEAVEQEDVVRPIKIHTIGKADAEARREYPGSIRAFQHADMGFEVAGRVEEFHVSEGDDVVQGEVLAHLDDRDYVAALNASKANLRKAESDLRRSNSIFKEDPGAISKETIDTHQRAVDVANAELAVTQKAFEDTKLRAPFSGRMARKLVVNVPERDVAIGPPHILDEDMSERNERVDPEIIVSALPHLKFPGWIKEFASTADPVTRTFSIKLNFENPGNVNILPGMTARVQVTVNPERAWSVPVSAAIADDNGKAFVWRVDPQSMAVSRAPVELGDLVDDRVRITSGLEDGDMVAISGVNQLRDDMVVRLLEP